MLEDNICVFKNNKGIKVLKYHCLKHIKKINMVSEGACQERNWYKEEGFIQDVEGRNTKP